MHCEHVSREARIKKKCIFVPIQEGNVGLQGFSDQQYTGLIFTDRLVEADKSMIKLIKLTELLKGLEENVMREPDSAHNDHGQMSEQKLAR